MYGSQQISLKAQRGVSLTGLIVVMGIIIAVAMVGMKVLPGVLEYKSIKDAIVVAKGTKGTPADIRLSFNKAADINNIKTITGQDLIIEKVNGETEVAFDYDDHIELFKNVSLIVHYAGTTDKSGIVPERSATPVK